MKKTKYPKSRVVEFTISDFANGIDAETDENITSFDKSVNSYNFEYKNGALTESIGFEDLTIPRYKEEGSVERAAIYYNEESDGTFKKLAHFKEYSERFAERKDKIFYISGDNQVYLGYIIGPQIFSRLEEIVFQEVPKMKNYTDGERDCILFFDDTDGMNSWNNNVDTIHYSNMPTIHDFTIYKDRVFAVPSGERLTVLTDNTNLLTWTSDDAIQNGNQIDNENESEDEEAQTSGRITITLDSERGYVNKLLTFNGYLFLVRDFGISRIYWYGANNYNLSHLLCSGSRIYSNTACVCGDRGLVLCKDGIYEFDNVSAKKLDLKLNRMLEGVSNQNAVAAFRNGIYYLACRLNFGDNKTVGCENSAHINNALILFDTQTNKYSICRGVDIVDLCSIQYLSADKLLACFNGTYANKLGQLTNNGQMFGTNQTKFWRSPLSDLGYSDKIKYVKEVSLLSLYDIKLTVFSENETREFDIKGSNIISRVPVRVKGKQIGISITSNTQKAYVSNLKLVANLVDNEYV